jgi:NAD(P)-dependent dehydrogenase (short-subunit alcohol dehydrogenase family)
VTECVALGAGLEGEGVLVTGGAGGIGRAVAATFAHAGARVCAVDLDPAVRDVVARLPGEGHTSVVSDVGVLARHDALLEQAESEVGSLNALAHLAAILRRQPSPAEIDEANWDAQVDLNLKAAFFLNRAFAERLRVSGRTGAIVNLSSQGWWTGGFGGSLVYNATKGAVVTMTRGLARFYATAGIRVNAVAPGLVDTPMLRDGMTDAALAALVAQVPLGRIGEPDEVAAAVVFLASKHASYITGATLNVSGGWLMY